MYKIPNIYVNLGEYGKQELDFQSAIEIVADLGTELVKDAGAYAYFDFVLSTLKKQYEKQKINNESYAAGLREQVQELLIQRGDKKPTVKDIDAAVQQDEKLLRLAEEQAELQSQIDRVRGFLTALSHKHSNLKELSRREIAGLVAESTEVKHELPETRGPKERRGRKHKEENNA